MDWFPGRRHPADALTSTCPRCDQRIPVKEISFHARETCPKRVLVKRKACPRCSFFIHPDEQEDHEKRCAAEHEERAKEAVPSTEKAPPKVSNNNNEDTSYESPSQPSILVPKKKEIDVDFEKAWEEASMLRKPRIEGTWTPMVRPPPNVPAKATMEAQWCPVCEQMVYSVDMNGHVNYCLDRDRNPETVNKEVFGESFGKPNKVSNPPLATPTVKKAKIDNVVRVDWPKWITAPSRTHGLRVAIDLKGRIVDHLPSRRLPRNDPFVNANVRGCVPTLQCLAYDVVFVKEFRRAYALPLLSAVGEIDAAWIPAAKSICIDALAVEPERIFDDAVFRGFPTSLRVEILAEILNHAYSWEYTLLVRIVEVLIGIAFEETANDEKKPSLSSVFYSKDGRIPPILKTIELGTPAGFFGIAAYVLRQASEYPNLLSHLVALAQQPEFMLWTETPFYATAPDDVKTYFFDIFATSRAKRDLAACRAVDDDEDFLVEEDLVYSYSDED
jgi:hypothetical protein